MLYTYVITSIKYPSKTYIGFTSDFQNRLIAHNHPNNTGYTKRFQPWKLALLFQFQTKDEAIEKEKWLKTGIGREWIKKQMSY